MITPTGTVRLLNVPFSLSQNNILKFSSKNEQINYMENHVIKSYSNVTYCREEEGEYLKVRGNVDDLQQGNYIMWNNKNKWYFAFIKRHLFVNNNVTNLELELDTWQTYQFDIQFKKSFIERQSFDNDYYNTLDDVPSTGELETVEEHQIALTGYYFILFNSDPTFKDSNEGNPGKCHIDNYTIPGYLFATKNCDVATEVINACSNKGYSDRIQSAWYQPALQNDEFIVTKNSVPSGELGLDYNLDFVTLINSQRLFENYTFNFSFNFEFIKEKCLPYCQIEIVDSITGQTITLDYSKFANEDIEFRLQGVISENPYFKFTPLNYNGERVSIQNSLVVSPSTELPIINNTYAKYMKDNKTSNLINMGMSAVGGVASAYSGSPVGVAGSFASISQCLTSQSVASTQGNQITSFKGDVFEYANNSPCIIIRVKTMDKYHKEIARNYWNCFGYPVKKITNLNFNSQHKFNFIKTVDCNIKSLSCPQLYLENIKNIFDKGVTIWNRDYLEY